MVSLMQRRRMVKFQDMALNLMTQWLVSATDRANYMMWVRGDGVHVLGNGPRKVVTLTLTITSLTGGKTDESSVAN
jgi:hypothetical protein